MKTISLIIFLIVSINTKFILPQTITLKGKVFDEKKNPVKNISIRFSTIGTVTTTNSGEFIIELPEEITSVELEIADKEWLLLYPFDNRIIIPSNRNEITKIVVKSAETQKAEKLDYAAKNYNKLESLLKDIGVAKDELKNLVENYIKKEAPQYDVQKDSLRNAILNEKKREKFDIISKAILNYIGKLQNSKDDFKLITQLAFNDILATKTLIKSIEEYNNAFNEINNSKYIFQKDISEYWLNENLAEEFLITIDYALDEIHKPYILRLNDYIVGINKIVRNNISDIDEKDKLKINISDGISSIVREMEIRIPIFEKKANKLIIKLKDSI